MKQKPFHTPYPRSHDNSQRIKNMTCEESGEPVSREEMTFKKKKTFSLFLCVQKKSLYLQKGWAYVPAYAIGSMMQRKTGVYSFHWLYQKMVDEITQMCCLQVW